MLTTEKIKEILDNSPQGADCIDADGFYWRRHPSQIGSYVWKKERSANQMAWCFTLSAPRPYGLLKLAELSVAINELYALKRQNAELVAQSSLLINTLKFAENKLYILVNTKGGVTKQVRTDALKAFDAVKSAITTTPVQHILEVQAEAGWMGFVKGYESFKLDDSPNDKLILADKYYEDVLNGEVK